MTANVRSASELAGKLREKENQLFDCRQLSLKIQKVANMGAYVYETATGLWTSSPVLDEIFGIDNKYKRDVDGWLKLVSDDYREEMKKYFIKEVLGRRSRFNKIYKISRRKDGKVLWVHGYGDLEIDNQGKVEKMVGVIQDITREKLIEDKQKVIEQKHRRLFDSLFDAYVVVDMKGGIVDNNLSFCKMLGYSDKELSKKTYKDITPKKWHSAEDEIVRTQVLVNGVSELYEKEYLTKDGDIIPIELKTYLIKDDRGKPYGMWAIVRDIRERKQAEMVIETEKNELEKILANTKHGIAITDNKLFLQKINPHFSEVFGYIDGELVNKSLMELVSPPDREEALKRLQSVFLGKVDSLCVEERYLRKDNNVVWGRTCLSSIKDEKGKIINFVVSLEDITDDRVASEALKKSEEQLKGVLMNMSDGVFVVDEKGKILMVNPSFEKLIGVYENDLIGSIFCKKVLFLDNDKKELFCKELWNPSKRLLFERGEVNMITAEEKILPVEGGYSPITDKSGNPHGGIMTVRDATNMRREDRMRKDFISLASHQIRTPLTGIKWFVELMRDIDKDEGRKELDLYLDKIAESNERLIQLINDLLMVSRLESGKLPELVTKKISLRNLIKDSLADQIGLMKEKNVRVVGVDLISESVSVVGDKSQLTQVFGNILNNAIKYSKKDSEVEVRIDSIKKQCCVTLIEDEGIGIPKDQQNRLYEKFFRGRNVPSDTVGSGLGMYMIKNMVEMNNGRVWVESAEGKGTKVYVELPCIESEESK